MRTKLFKEYAVYNQNDLQVMSNTDVDEKELLSLKDLLSLKQKDLE